MNHIVDIECLIKTLVQSSRFHALVVESPAGWGKSSTLERTLNELGLPHYALGAYVTPFALYKAIVSHPNEILLLDDCAGLFGDPVGMAVLKAASWASAGSRGERIVAWSSTSEKIAQPTVPFSGKIILLANSIPQGRDTRAFLSRTLHLQIRFDGEQAAQMLTEASRRTDYFEDQATAEKIAVFLSERARNSGVQSINLRTLEMGYDLAKSNPDSWPALLEKLVPQNDPKVLLETLGQSALGIEEQSREFTRLTGLSRRTFFNYRKGLAASS